MALFSKDSKKLVFIDVSVLVFVDNLKDLFNGRLWYFFILHEYHHLLVRNKTVMIQIKIYKGFLIMLLGQNLFRIQAGD